MADEEIDFDASLTLKSLSTEARRRLSGHAMSHRWKRFARVSSPAETVERLFLVKTGSLEVRRTHPAKERHLTLYVLGPGDCFDLLTLLDGRPHDVDRRALTPVEAVSFPREEVVAEFDTNASLRSDVLTQLADRVRSVETMAEELVVFDTGVRLARLLLRHTDPSRPGNGPHLAQLSDGTLASMIGSVRTVVNRQLRSLRDEGAITHTAEGIAVRDLERLKQRCELREIREGEET